jgi:hypothetical protein
MSIFRHTWRSSVIDESLVVEDDGQVLLRVLQPLNDAHRSAVGTYQVGADLDRVRRICSKTGLTPTGFNAQSNTDQAVDDALAAELRTEALGHPLAVLRATASFVNPIRSLHMITIVVENVGTVDVVFDIDPSAFRLHRNGETQTLSPPSIGFVDGEGHLLDGLHTPATVPAGFLAACSLAGRSTPHALAFDSASWVSFSGRLAPVRYPPLEDAGLAAPTDQFVVRTEAFR